MVMATRRDSALRATIQDADLVVPDGVGVVWAARLAGERVPGRVPGVDLLAAFAARAARRGYRIFLLGGAAGVAEAAGAHLVKRFPGLVVAGTFAGSPSSADEPEILGRIVAARPDAVFVAFGSPAQERWIARTRGQLGVAVAIGIGGALDFLAGRVPRAPGWMRQLGLEWLYRLWREPWRFRRMLALPRFAVLALWNARYRR
jgi:N-acetylglucosaminyldiphosphoundecaprenol N-acetyl-beta-D-mannosaminyltransferase